MSNRREFYFRQQVTQDDLNDAFDQQEAADKKLSLDNGLACRPVSSTDSRPVVGYNGEVGLNERDLLGGIHDGWRPTVSVTGANVLRFSITAGLGTSPVGTRIETLTTYTIDCSVSGETAIGQGGNTLGGSAVNPNANEYRWVLLYIKPARMDQDGRIDGASQVIYWKQNESFQFGLKIGVSGDASAALAGKPGPDADTLILGEYRLHCTGTALIEGDIVESYQRRSDWLRSKFSAGGNPPDELHDGLNTDALIRGDARKAIVRIMQVLAAGGDAHAATRISTSEYTGLIAHTFPEYSVGTTPKVSGLDGMLNDLLDLLGSSAGAAANTGAGNIGIRQWEGSGDDYVNVLAAGSLEERSSAIIGKLNSHIRWAESTSPDIEYGGSYAHYAKHIMCPAVTVANGIPLDEEQLATRMESLAVKVKKQTLSELIPWGTEDESRLVSASAYATDANNYKTLIQDVTIQAAGAIPTWHARVHADAKVLTDDVTESVGLGTIINANWVDSGGGTYKWEHINSAPVTKTTTHQYGFTVAGRWNNTAGVTFDDLDPRNEAPGTLTHWNTIFDFKAHESDSDDASNTKWVEFLPGGELVGNGSQTVQVIVSGKAPSSTTIYGFAPFRHLYKEAPTYWSPAVVIVSDDDYIGATTNISSFSVTKTTKHGVIWQALVTTSGDYFTHYKILIKP